MFRVYISGEYETSKRCHLNGAYNLLVKDTSLCLCDLASNRVFYEWPHKYIRRYGKTHSSFHFVAGRRCSTGKGEFVVETNQGPEILRAVTGTWKTPTERVQARGYKGIRSPDEEQRAAEGHTNENIIGARQGYLDKNRSRDARGVYSEPYSIDTEETYLTAVAEEQHYNALDSSRAGRPPKSDVEHIYSEPYT